jgi:hypothetical protein
MIMLVWGSLIHPNHNNHHLQQKSVFQKRIVESTISKYITSVQMKDICYVLKAAE